MKIFRLEQIPTLDAATIAGEPIESIDLMERASRTVAEWIGQRYGNVPTFVVCGPGNNGGDGLAVARMLARQEGSQINVAIFYGKSGRLSADAQTNLNRLEQNGLSVTKATAGDTIELPEGTRLIVDALFGSGQNRPLDQCWQPLVDTINASEADVISIDMPSGLGREDMLEDYNRLIIRATHTISFQCPKLAFMLADAAPFVGQWHVTDIGLLPQAIDSTPAPFEYADACEMRKLLKPRSKHSYKNNFGHALLVAGSEGMMGAARLAAEACLRSGIGLLTVAVPRVGLDVIQTSVPEAMATVVGDKHWERLPDTQKYQAFGMGPGLGRSDATRAALVQTLKAIKHQDVAVLDADALFHLAAMQWPELPPRTVITPHAGEFDRLTHRHTSSYGRLMTAIEFATEHRICVVLKGAHTAVVSTEGRVWFNSTGNPGMATAGSGDVLTGMVLALAARMDSAFDAARLAVYLHGLAGDIAAAEHGQTSMLASDIVKNIGRAFVSLQGGI